eukprot:GHVN01087731.1.p2 GENE.GHVN01087731.1~~GHVN01087731.1.p2  ORF type:complete len:244 (-),score=47.07 GHVN01087731.1:875-1606(-)
MESDPNASNVNNPRSFSGDGRPHSSHTPGDESRQPPAVTSAGDGIKRSLAPPSIQPTSHNSESASLNHLSPVQPSDHKATRPHSTAIVSPQSRSSSTHSSSPSSAVSFLRVGDDVKSPETQSTVDPRSADLPELTQSKATSERRRGHSLTKSDTNMSVSDFVDAMDEGWSDVEQFGHLTLLTEEDEERGVSDFQDIESLEGDETPNQVEVEGDHLSPKRHTLCQVGREAWQLHGPNPFFSSNR